MDMYAFKYFIHILISFNTVLMFYLINPQPHSEARATGRGAVSSGHVTTGSATSPGWNHRDGRNCNEVASFAACGA